jgi:hypothetical protein
MNSFRTRKGMTKDFAPLFLRDETLRISFSNFLSNEKGRKSQKENFFSKLFFHFVLPCAVSSLSFSFDSRSLDFSLPNQMKKAIFSGLFRKHPFCVLSKP